MSILASSLFLLALLSLVVVIIMVAVFPFIASAASAYANPALQTSKNTTASYLTTTTTTTILPLALTSGAIIGISLGLVGGGGSILAVPLLLYFVGIKDPHIAIGTSAMAVGVTALINAIQHYKRGNVSLRHGIMFAIPGGIGSLIGSQIGLITPANSLLLMFALLMVIISVKMLRDTRTVNNKPNALKKAEVENKISTSNIKNGMVDTSSSNNTSIDLIAVTTPIKKNNHHQPQQQWQIIILTGFGVGFAAGYFGIGGGFLIVPALMHAAGLTISTAIGTSLISVSTLGFMTATRYSFEGLVNVFVSLLLIIGGIGGSIFSTKIGSKLNRRTLTKIFAVMLIFVAVYIIARSIPFNLFLTGR